MKYIYRFLNEQTFVYGELLGSKLEEPDEQPFETSDNENEPIPPKQINNKLTQTSITRFFSSK